VVQTEDIKAKNELRDLVIIFNKLAEEIDSRQEQLIQSRKMASIGTLTSGVAHELNNPLNNISLTTEILLEEYDSLPVDEAKEMIGEVISEINRASEVVRNLLDFSRGDQPSFLSLQIETVIRDTLKILKNQLMLGSIRFKSNIPKSLPIINGNKDKLTQVFLNLFLNSIQAMPNGGEMSIEVKNEPENYLRIDCKDTGIGMKPDDLEKVFDPFFTTKSVGKGTGLGLSIVYGIINKHRGYIEVKSEIDVGTTFSIFLPVAVSKDSLT
jgi:signal transduction histidine kinase